MKRLFWSGVLTAVASATFWCLHSHPSLAQPARIQQQPAKQQESSSTEAWVPVDRIDPSRPATIRLINNAYVPIEYGFSITQTQPQTLEPAETVVLTIPSIPATLLINALNPMAVLDYGFGTSRSNEDSDENSVTVTISLVDDQYNAAGFSAIDIHETGAIYRY